MFNVSQTIGGSLKSSKGEIIRSFTMRDLSQSDILFQNVGKFLQFVNCYADCYQAYLNFVHS